MRKTIHALLFLLTLLPLNVIPQRSYTAETSDKKYIFVIRRTDGEDYLVGDKYKWSGMYANDGSSEPLWTVDWQQRVYLPDDGKHVVRIGGWNDYSATYREESFAFFSDGKPLKAYRVNELITFPYLLPHSSAGYGINYAPLDPDLKHDGVVMKVDHGSSGYPINSGANFDNEKRTMRIETYHGDRYLFDYTTGNIISAERPSRDLGLVLFGALFVAYSAFPAFAARRGWSATVRRLTVAAIGIITTLGVFLIPILSILPYKSSGTPYDPNYPDFWTCCYLSVSMLPQYLLTSLNAMSPAVNNFHDYSVEANLYWLIFFWFPVSAFFAGLSHFIISFIITRRSLS